MAITGLFGSSPYELQQGRQAALSKAADAYGQTNPNDPYGFDRARSGLYMAGSQLGGGIAGLLGAEDPEMKKAADLQAILQQFDMTTPQGLMQAGQAAQAKGYGNEAMQAFAKARELQKASADIAKTEAETLKAMRERQGADPLQQLIRTGKYTPASVQKYAESGNVSDLDNVEKADQTALSETSEGIFLINKTTGDRIAREVLLQIDAQA